MWQHRWAVWSGILGATASCLAKLAMDSDSLLLQGWNLHICPSYVVKTDLDVLASKYIYRILGDMMIKYRLGSMPMQAFQAFRRNVVEEIVLKYHIFDVDWCQVLMLGPRVLCFVAMLLLNVYMIATFLKGMEHSGSVVGTALNTAANFTCSAIYGYFLWQERFALQWWMGFAFVLTGVLMLSFVQSSDDRSRTSTEKKDARSSRYEPKPPPPLWPPTKKTASSLRQYGAATKSPTSSFPGAVSIPGVSSNRPSSTARIMQLLKQKKSLLSTSLIDRSFANECPLCEGQLFDESNGESLLAIADLSPNCFHVIHAKCLKQQPQHPQSSPGGGGGGNSSTCPLCQKTFHMFINAKQAAHFAGFWMTRVEQVLKDKGPSGPNIDEPLPASVVRETLRNDSTLTEEQKRYIDDDPTGLGKGLCSALEWGGSVDYNEGIKGHVGWNQCLRTQGIWKYDPKCDDLWLWEWGNVHPRQRCEQCQFKKRPLPIQCKGCQGSSESAYYCSEACQRRDWQRHKMTCQLWQSQGPNKKKQ